MTKKLNMDILMPMVPMIQMLQTRLESNKKNKKNKKTFNDGLLENLENLKNCIISLINVFENHKDAEIELELTVILETIYNMFNELQEYKNKVSSLSETDE